MLFVVVVVALLLLLSLYAHSVTPQPTLFMDRVKIALCFLFTAVVATKVAWGAAWVNARYGFALVKFPPYNPSPAYLTLLIKGTFKRGRTKRQTKATLKMAMTVAGCSCNLQISLHPHAAVSG